MIAEASSQSGAVVAAVVGAVAIGLAVVQARRRTLSRRRPADDGPANGADRPDGTDGAVGADELRRDPGPPGPPPAGS